MSDIQLVFTPEDNNHYLLKPLCGKYKLESLEINASSTEGLIEAIRKMRIYFRFDYGSTIGGGSKRIELSSYMIYTDKLDNTINFRDKEITVNPKRICTNIHVAIADEVMSPITKMTLTLNKV